MFQLTPVRLERENCFVCDQDLVDDDGVWTTAQAKHAGKPYYVETKHHEQPKEFGIQNGKITKMYIYAGTSWDEKRCVCAYDHGWSKQPETRAAKAISNEIIAMYN